MPRDSGEGDPCRDRPLTTKPAAAKLTDPSLRLRRRSDSEPLRHVWALAYRVRGRTGRVRLVLVVQRCPAAGCGVHVHYAAADFERGRRTAPCGTRYIVLAIDDEGSVAA